MNHKLSNQAIGAIMMALQKSLMEQTDIVPVLQGFEIQVDDSGELVVVFHDREYPYYDIYAQKFDILGNKIGDAFLINSFTDEQQVSANITSIGNEGFAVVWEDIYQGNAQVKAKIFGEGLSGITVDEIGGFTIRYNADLPQTMFDGEQGEFYTYPRNART